MVESEASAAPNQLLARPSRTRMLRLQSRGHARNAATNWTRSVITRPHSTHAHGHSHNCDQDHGHPHPHEHHPAHTQSGASTGPASVSPPLDPTVSGSASESCKNLVRKRDYESFLTSKFYPTNAQDGFFALKAFYVYTLPSLSPAHTADFVFFFFLRLLVLVGF